MEYNIQDLWSQASLDDLKRGYLEGTEGYQCLCCGYQVERGVIYPEDGVLYEAYRYMQHHILKEHNSMLEYLLTLDKEITGLSDIQRKLLRLTSGGHSDVEIQKQLGIGSTSTIRNHRFQLREKEKQARVFLAVMELMKESDTAAGEQRKPTAGPAPVQSSEDEKVLKTYMPQGPQGALSAYPKKLKHKKLILQVVADRLEWGRKYKEPEINDLLSQIYGEDYAVLRRGLVDYGFVDRMADGSFYWRRAITTQGEKGEQEMTRRDELKQMAKEVKTEAGIFQIKNKQNGKVWIDSSRNLRNLNGQLFQLDTGVHRNKQLQEEYLTYGKEAFECEVLELLDEKELGSLTEKDSLRKLKNSWLEKLQPYGDQGYNKPSEVNHLP